APGLGRRRAVSLARTAAAGRSLEQATAGRSPAAPPAQEGGSALPELPPPAPGRALLRTAARLRAAIAAQTCVQCGLVSEVLFCVLLPITGVLVACCC